MSPTQTAAFNTAAGLSAGQIGTTIIVIVAGAIVLWGAHTVRMLLSQLMYEPKLMTRNMHFVFRAVILVMALIYLLS